MAEPLTRLFGHTVVGQCPECDGDGVIWGYDGQTFWADRPCPRCNCVGFILDLPDCWKKQSANPDEPDQSEDVPF